MPAKNKPQAKRKQPNKLLKLLQNKYVLFSVVFALVGGVYLLFSSSASVLDCKSLILNNKTQNQTLCISYLQKALTGYGYNTGSTDGTFSDYTKEAVKKFKEDIKAIRNVGDTTGENAYTIDPVVSKELCSAGAIGAQAEYCGVTTQSRGSTLVSDLRSLINKDSNTVTNVNTQITNTGGKTQIGNQSTAVTNTNTQVTNTGGQSKVGNSSSTPKPVDPAQEAAKAAARAALLQQIASQNVNTQYTNTGGQTQIGNQSTTVTNINTQYTNTGGQIVIDNTSSTCKKVTLNDPFSGVAKTYDICNTNAPIATGPTLPTYTPPPTQATPQPVSLSNHQCPGRTTMQYDPNFTVTECTKRIQDILNVRISSGLTVDGKFGNNTKSAVINFQTARGLQPDGIVGNQTWSALEGDATIAPIGTTNPVTPKPKAPSLPTGTQTPKTTPPLRPNVDQKTGTTTQLAAPSSSYNRNSDTHKFTYNGQGSELRLVNVCVSIAPTIPGQSMPSEVSTTSGEKISLSRDERGGIYTGCVRDGFSRKITSATYRVDKTGYWVAVYGSKL